MTVEVVCSNCRQGIPVTPLVRSVETIDVDQVTTIAGEIAVTVEKVRITFDEVEVSHDCPTRRLQI